MPKMMVEKPYSCPYCCNSYGSENSVYTHVRGKHPGLRYSKTQKVMQVCSNAKTQEQHKAKQLVDLKEKFMNNEINAETYEKTWRSIEKKYQVPVQYVDLDVGRLLDGDNNYLTTYLKGHSHLRSFIKLAEGCNYAALFSAVFNHQIRISNTDTGKAITYLDDGELVTEECEPSLIIGLYKSIVNGLTRTVLPKILTSVDELDEDSSLQHSYEAQRSFNDLQASIAMYRSLDIESALIPALEMFKEEIVVRTSDQLLAKKWAREINAPLQCKCGYQTKSYAHAHYIQHQDKCHLGPMDSSPVNQE